MERMISGDGHPRKAKISEIRILPFFAACPPREEKMERKRAQFDANGGQPRSLLVTPEGWLVDGYADYLVLLEHGMDDALYETACRYEGPSVKAACRDGRVLNVRLPVSMKLASRLSPGKRFLAKVPGRGWKVCTALSLDVPGDGGGAVKGLVLPL